MGIVLYSTGCPKCKVLKAKLSSKNIPYVEINDTDVMLAKGIMALPCLEIDNNILDFQKAVDWVNNAKEIIMP